MAVRLAPSKMALRIVQKRLEFTSFCRYFDVICVRIPDRNAAFNIRSYSSQPAVHFPSFSSCSSLVDRGIRRETIERPVCKQSRCWYSKEVESDESVDLTFADVQKLMKSERTTMVDVREPIELVEFGQYEDAVNIPLGQLEEALKLSKEEFQRRFLVEKPNEKDGNVVFCCLAGIRSFKAVQIASKLGFLRVKHYKGGWEDYHKQMGLPFKQTSNK